MLFIRGKSSCEEFYPQYCEVNSVPALVEELRQAAMIQELKLMQCGPKLLDDR